MNEALLTALGAACIVVAIVMWLRGWLFRFCILIVTLLAYTAGYAQLFMPVRLVMFSFTLVIVLQILISTGHLVSRRHKFIAAGFLAVCFASFTFGQFFIDENEADPLFRLILLYPLMFVAGFLLSRAGKTDAVAHIYVYVSLLMGVLAIVERLHGTFFVAGGYENADRLVRDGAIRSIVFTEHPLVLSVLLLAATPLIGLTFRARGLRFLAYAIIICGVLSTNSRGAAAILAAWFLLVSATKVKLLSRTAARTAKGVVVLVCSLAFLTILLGEGSNELSSSNAVDASAQYRGTLYTFAARSLFEQPWGWGLSGLPEGLYMVPSYFGALDIAKTVDSEVALAMFDFGWIGLVGILGLLLMQLESGRLATPVGQAAVIITLSGLYLALHSWAGLGSIWLLVAGLGFGSSLHRGALQRPVSTPAEV